MTGPTYAELADLMRGMPRVPRYVLRCHPDVRAALAAYDPHEPVLASIGSLFSVDVQEDPEMPAGAWAMVEDGQITDYGTIGQPFAVATVDGQHTIIPLSAEDGA